MLYLRSILFSHQHYAMKTFPYLIFLFLLTPTVSFGQKTSTDSLLVLLNDLAQKKKTLKEMDVAQKAFVEKNAKTPAQKVGQLTKTSLTLIVQDPNIAMLLSNDAEKIAELSQNDTLRAMAYVSISAVYSVKDNTDSILSYALKTLTISERTPLNPDIMASMYRKFGRVYRDQNNMKACIEAYDKAMAYSTKVNNYKDMSGTAATLTQIYSRIKQFDKALIYQKQALDLSIKIGFSDNIVRCHLHLIGLYEDLGKISELLNAVSDMANWMKKLEISPIVKGLAYTKIADCDLRYGKTNRQLAANYLDSMQALLKITTPGSDNVANYYLNRSLFEFSRQKYQNGIDALNQYHVFKEISDKDILEGHSQELSAKYETGKKDALIENLNTEKALQKKANELSNLQRNGAAVLAGLLAIMTYLFFTRYRLKKKTSEALAQKNDEIEQQKAIIQNSLSEKETLLREIHHRVKNNLQIISSLLDIQSANIQDENVLSSIQEGQSRVQAMSLIHQNLYQSDHLNNVDIENYLRELVAYLSGMFAGEDKSIEVNVNASNITFDIDTAIPLGLIVNELVSNAYKYAFDKHAKGHISVNIKAFNDSDYELEVKDDGKGFSDDFDEKKPKSLGLKLVKILSRQLRGSFSAKSDNGAKFTVRFKDLSTL